MYRVGALLLSAVLLVGCSNKASDSGNAAAGKDKTTSEAVSNLTPEQAELAAEDELMSLEMGFNKAQADLMEKVRAAAPEKQMEIYMNESKDKEFAAKHLELAKKYPDTGSEFTAIQFAMANGDEATIDAATSILESKYVNDDRLCEMLETYEMIASPPQQSHENFLKRIIEESTSNNVKGGASFALAKLYSSAESLKGMIGDEHLAEMDPKMKEMMSFVLKDRGDNFSSKLEKMYDSLSQEYSDVPFGGKTIGELAEEELFVFKHLSLGKVAPDIEGVDLDGKEFKLSEYRGKVVMLDFWGDW